MSHPFSRNPRRAWVLAACALALAAFARQDAGARIDAFIYAEITKQNIPGVSLAVVREGQPPLIRSYGLANLEHQVPVRPETIFQSGSVGKQFTSAAVMLLVEDGKIEVDDPVSKHLGAVPDAWTALTVRHLLTHTGGLTDYPKGFDFRRNYSEDELLKVIQGVPLAFTPGERFQYSNLGYVTLGILIGKVTGKFYGELLQERIFKPLGMTTARIISEADLIAHRAAGYRVVQGQLKNQEWVSPSLNTTADGSLYLSVLDMIKWEIGLRSASFIKQSSLDAAWTPATLTSGAKTQYGFGWAVGAQNGRRLISHGGAWQGFVAHIARYVDDGLTVIVFVNRAGVQAASLATGVARILAPDLVEKPAPDNEPGVTAAHRALLESLIAGSAIDKSIFTAQVASEILPRIDQSRGDMKALGPIDGIELLQRTSKDGNQVHQYRVRFRNANALYMLSINADGKIAGLNLRPE